MKRSNKLLCVSVIVIIAGLLDIKYKGLFYRTLPDSVKSGLEDLV
ncbi:hypothetical protein ACFO3D_08950 [Virgibacillus kekensis]|uniref:Uncharacterized protein n=1 Tax=Virgibacillus kekensis TaxID=202261 RepID=A0ABV9DHM6_9BACI